MQSVPWSTFRGGFTPETHVETYTLLQNNTGDSKDTYWMLPTLAGVQSAKSLFGGVVRLVESARMAGKRRGRMI